MSWRTEDAGATGSLFCLEMCAVERVWIIVFFISQRLYFPAAAYRAKRSGGFAEKMCLFRNGIEVRGVICTSASEYEERRPTRCNH